MADVVRLPVTKTATMLNNTVASHAIASNTVAITQAQMLVVAMIGAVLLTLSVCNFVLFTLYCKQMRKQAEESHTETNSNSLSCGLEQPLALNFTVDKKQISMNTYNADKYAKSKLNVVDFSNNSIGQGSTLQIQSTKQKELQYMENHDWLPNNIRLAEVHKSLYTVSSSSGCSDVQRYHSTKSLEIPVEPSANHKVFANRGADSSQLVRLSAHCLNMNYCCAQVKNYVDLGDFENDTDLEFYHSCDVSDVTSYCDSVISYAITQSAPYYCDNCEVVEFQNYAFEFTESKTSLEEMTDTEL